MATWVQGRGVQALGGDKRRGRRVSVQGYELSSKQLSVNLGAGQNHLIGKKYTTEVR